MKQFIQLTKTEWKRETKRVAIVILCTLVYGIGMAWFLEPAQLYSGGIPGISQLIRNLTLTYLNIDLNLGLMVLVFNLPIIYLGWKGVSHRFTIYSIISIIVQTIILGFIPVYDLGLSDPLTQSIIGGLLIGIGTGIALKYGTSTGGIDIIAQYLSFKKGASVGMISLTINIIIAMTAGAVFGWPIAMYTIIRNIVTTYVTDKTHTAYNYLAVEIITAKEEEITAAILEKIYRGVTSIPAKGAYSKQNKAILYVIISSYELNALLDQVRHIDDKAFIITKPVKNVFGSFKRKTIV